MSITKNDLDHALAANNEVLRAELASKQDLEVLRAEFRTELQVSEARTHAHVDHAIEKQTKALEDATRAIHESNRQQTQVIIESFREQFGALDDKYRDLPKTQAELRDDLDAHVREPGLHRRAKRSR